MVWWICVTYGKSGANLYLNWNTGNSKTPPENGWSACGDGTLPLPICRITRIRTGIQKFINAPTAATASQLSSGTGGIRGVSGASNTAATTQASNGDYSGSLVSAV